MARPVRRPRGDGLLARRAQAAGHLQPADDLLGLRGRRDAPRAASHDTDAEIETNITDTHGASIIGFAFCELLGFRLMPRLKQIGKLRLYRPGLDTDKPWSAIAPVISARPINWELIAQHYDELVR
jgi:hypothetical protein